jgi:hypothetical protein
LKGEDPVTKNEFSAIRHRLEKTQEQMAQILGISLKSVQSFEQGWRKVTPQAERQALFLLAHRAPSAAKRKPCWEVRNCPSAVMQNCPAWEFTLGHLCWFVNGTLCQGEAQRSWQDKMKICRQCEVFEAAEFNLQDPV